VPTFAGKTVARQLADVVASTLAAVRGRRP
jgi:hypothetical protein